ncbi:serine/threonine protein kinase [Dolichospermum sp. ST_sed1]|nr:serine/threonine protein kinase [Dolichospermum sp. ST_sed1]MDD1426886.1 serine/threonine protein kinase [Dolichospermum sp. ST_sed9]MDD1432403.1 serine/threonine protein kinase [Dolichospermum sp. ST_sed6]MDD1441773.1 serine/threonine protein kinase [Dolichospermum sp. ST_sed3]MDD1447545.1 serine/threonine protein kinase [Dolichospermum sp. ST_sed8]MDD1454817.1 serine/threonine protein kinase [Dolichospermum sp. ST_sed7]MDD1460014.1 serine/threonine protein kinase [Dolichospermum sp. ST_s
MSSYPDFQAQGYQVTRELGRNREGGRITWLATNINTGQPEVIKQFCFAQAGSSWSGSEAHAREIQVLKGLDHSGIPSYLHSFETSDGFCLIQEYIHGSTLAEPRSFSPAEIKQIAIKILEILVYLQNRIPSVIHRDIKPENILVDEQINVYLIDFGFARIGSHDVAGSSVFKGTPGFIPPEQMFKPTNATDLYALGATLICLLTGIKSTKIDELQDADDPYLIKFRHLLPRLSLRFIGWLEKMVQPKQKDRFTNAEAALESLKPLDVIRVPGVDFSETVLEFEANRLGEKLTRDITIENPIPDTLLEGKWEVAPHPQDPPHTPDHHAWISVKPAQFSGNHIRFQVQVDTSKLMADKQYKRQLILHSNAYPASHTLMVKVQTAALPIEKRQLPYWRLIAMFLLVVVAAMSITWSIPYLRISDYVFGVVSGCLWFLVYRLFRQRLAVAVAGAVAVAVYLAEDMAKEAKNLFTNILILLILGLGISVGTGIIIGFNTFILLALNGTSLPALFMLLYPPLKRRKLIAKYRQSEESLIKP